MIAYVIIAVVIAVAGAITIRTITTRSPIDAVRSLWWDVFGWPTVNAIHEVRPSTEAEKDHARDLAERIVTGERPTAKAKTVFPIEPVPGYIPPPTAPTSIIEYDDGTTG